MGLITNWLGTFYVCDVCGAWDGSAKEPIAFCKKCIGREQRLNASVICCGMDFVFLADSKAECDLLLTGTDYSIKTMAGPILEGDLLRFETWELSDFLST